ncbi:Bacterial type II secretion system protein F domain protein [Rosistilla carotiformis]|uniref:Bacterial type II secretion system protein F domain protein n=1 Tax=Rosistilla carotiformis TaxID=2528017 RepID=A0A518JW40_9BACT|nr:type II secretion system F family protein [Rosistilla carotiformis]QDV69754.1 Bacterial type II secretion system protein F domain protein [Rosistilla carotiformis]
MFAADLQTTGFIVFGAIFVGVSAVAWLILGRVSGGDESNRAESRLDEMRQIRRSNEARNDPDATKKEALASVLNRAAPLANSLQPKDEVSQGKLKLRLMQAGFRNQGASTMFLTLKVLSAIVGLVIGGGIAVIAQGFSQDALLKLVIAGGIMFFLPELALSWIISCRKQNIFLGLPDALDLMVVCVEAGLGLDQAMRKVSTEMGKTYKVIAEEFGVANAQLQLGRPRNEVLKLLGNRSDVDDLKALASILIQADKFGSSIAQALRVQSDSMRVKRRQIAEEKAAKSAVKLIFPLVIFIFPGIFVVLVGPAAIAMIAQDSF